MKQKILVLISLLLTTQLTNAQNEIINPDNIVEAGKIKWSNTNDTILNICYDTKLDSNIFIDNVILPKANEYINEFEGRYNSTYYDMSQFLAYSNCEYYIQQWIIYNEKKERIKLFELGSRDYYEIILDNQEFRKKYKQNTGQLPTTVLNKLIELYFEQGTYKIERDIYFGTENNIPIVYTSNQLTLIIHNNKYTKPIELLKNEPIESGDNVYLGFQKETTDSLYTINWLINGKKDSTLTYKNLYQIDKNYTGKLDIKLQTTTKLSGCTAYDSVELNVKPRKIDTIYVTKTDTIYIEKEPNKTAIINKQTNLNVWPNPTTTFVNAEAEEPFSYTLLNNEGKILKKEEGEPSYTISMNEYPDGVYYIKTSDGVIRKIVKE